VTGQFQGEVATAPVGVGEGVGVITTWGATGTGRRAGGATATGRWAGAQAGRVWAAGRTAVV